MKKSTRESYIENRIVKREKIKIKIEIDLTYDSKLKSNDIEKKRLGQKHDF